MGSGVACVLFTDVVGSTDLMRTVADAGFDSVRTEHFSCVGRARQLLAEVKP